MTYSIVALDAAAGEMGVAVQSHWMAVGAVVGWAESGVGVVATQAFADPEYGPRGLSLMRDGAAAVDALEGALRSDEERERRQVAMLDVRGRVATHTGTATIPAAGHALGEAMSAQANMMWRDSVWPRMVEAYASEGDLTSRLLAALDAAEAEGGDIRGQQSAAILVVAIEPSGSVSGDRHLDLRVEDHPQPLVELRRVVDLHRAYGRFMDVDERTHPEEATAALASHLEAAAELGPGNPEGVFWGGVALANLGRLDDARRELERAYAVHDGWRELVRRLPAAGLLDAEAVERLT